MKRLLLDLANGFTRVVPESIVALYWSRELDKKQFAMLLDVIKQYNSNSDFVIKVTSIRTLCDVLNFCGGGKQLLSQVHTILKLFLTV